MREPSISAEEFFQEGTRQMGQGNTQSAEYAFRQAIRLEPELAEAHANLALLLERTGHNLAAEESYHQAIELAPQQFQTYINFGAMLAAQRRFAEAENSYMKALALNPESHVAWSNLGVLLACTKREKESEQCYRTAIALAPEYRNASFNLAYLLLRQERYEEGWACLEHRNWYEKLENQIDAPRWQGEPLAGKSFLIGIESGHGDMIQFCRYASKIKGKGAARVSVLCHPALKNLFHRLSGIDDAIALGEPPPDIKWDYWSPPLSLPFLFQTCTKTIPANLPYLKAEPELIEHWSCILGDTGNDLRVGLVWKGNPSFENDSERSLRSLEEFSPLGLVTGVRYFSLQKGAGENEAACSCMPFPIVDLGSRVSDFSDTAAILMNLDLVIAVDTAIVHLAGALGKPCWVLLPDYKTDWRWLSNRDDSPWYPKVMRLFRQKPFSSWETVIAQVKIALENLKCSGFLLNSRMPPRDE